MSPRVGDVVQFVKDQNKGLTDTYRIIAIDGDVAWIRHSVDGKYHNAWLPSLTTTGAK